jgi:hypothetical protein
MSLQAASEALREQAQGKGRFRVQMPLLRVPFSMVSRSTAIGDGEDALAFANDFIADPTVNLLIVLGEVGSGKSELLRQLAKGNGNREASPLPLLLDYAEMSKHLAASNGSQAITQSLERCSGKVATEFSDIVKSEPSRLLLLIDAFDEINIALHVNDTPPTPHVIPPFVHDGLKTVVAARQSLGASAEAMANVFERYPDISYQILELKPCDLDEVGRALEELADDQASVIHDYLRRDKHIQMSRVRRPLFLQMLMDLPPEMLEKEGGLSIWELYDRYVDVTLDTDIQRKVTLIPRESKRKILQNVAKDAFDRQVSRSEAQLEPSHVEQRVTEEINNPENRHWVEAPSGNEYDWVGDFNRSNHLLVDHPTSYARSTRQVEFVHQSLFEFFLTQHFATRFATDGSFGLEDDTHSVRAFDSLLPYFLRSQLGIHNEPHLEEELIRLVKSSESSNIDRLLGFFFLEDSPQILEALNDTDNAYRAYLHRAASQFESFFMQKVVRYQITLLDTGMGQALAYVSDARAREKDRDQDIEVHTFAAGQDPTEFLLARLENDRLQNAKPITVYRLGQFADSRAIKPLEMLRDNAMGKLDPCLDALIEEAIDSISSRGPAGGIFSQLRSIGRKDRSD